MYFAYPKLSIVLRRISRSIESFFGAQALTAAFIDILEANGRNRALPTFKRESGLCAANDCFPVPGTSRDRPLLAFCSDYSDHFGSKG